MTDFDDAKQTIMKANIGDTDPGNRDADGLTVTYPGLVLPDEASKALFNGAIVVADMFNGHRRWWHVRLLEGLSPITGILCVLFYAHSPQHIPHKLIEMAAAVITVDPSSHKAIYEPESHIYGRYEALATVELVGSTNEMELYVGRRDRHFRMVEQLSGTMKRSWTVQ